ncbi:MAG: hypothetical protein K2H53_04175 [Clostridia bacterium]|nr:hypothetical protein [Clostridia bacterium]
MFKVSIPKISDEEMMKRYAQIKPVITRNGKLYSLREYTLEEITGTSYTWNLEEDVREEIGKDELEVLEGKEFVCLHGYGYPGFFKPSVGEVLAQIKEHDLHLVKAFEIIASPETKSDFSKDSFTSIAFDNGYHVSTVRLYGKKR